MTAPKTKKQHARAVLVLGLPIIGSHLAQFGIHMTDTVMLGWHSVEELAAVVLAGTFWFMLFIVGSGFGFAVMPIVASAASVGDDIEVRRSTRMSLWLSFIYAVCVMPLMLLAQPLLGWIGQEPQIAQMAGQYLKIAGWSIFPALGVMVIKSYLSALERTQFVLVVTIGAVFLNALINYALIFGNFGAPEMGLTGAAIASVFVNFFTLALLWVYAARAVPEHTLFQRMWRPDWAGFVRVFQLGWPIGLTNMAEVGLFTGAAVFMGWIGTHELAAHGIAIQIASATFLVHMGLSNAATIRAGNAFGRRDEQALRDGGTAAMFISAGFVLATMALFFSIPDVLAGLFVDPSDPVRPQIVALAATLLLFAAVFQAADAGQVMVLGLLRGVQDTKIPMIMAAFSYWLVAMPASYFLAFPMGFGVQGVWSGLVIGLLFAWVLLSIRYWGRSVKIG